MAIYEVLDGGAAPAVSPAVVAAPVPERAQIERLRGELDGYYRAMQGFVSLEPDQVMLQLSAFSARASEIRTHLSRSDGRLSNAFRTREIEPFIDECDRQFKLHSRILSQRELDWRISAGQP